jgi:hypothetical protein
MVAVEICLVSFDLFNEFLDRTAGLTIRDLNPGAAEKRTWVSHAAGDFAFQTGIAYVNRVRFSDGTFWKADLRAVGVELKKFQKDFDVAILDHQAAKR